MRRLHRPLDLLELARALAPGYDGDLKKFGAWTANILDELMDHAGFCGPCPRCLGTAVLSRKDEQQVDCPYCLGGYDLTQTTTQEEFWDADTKATEAKK